MRTITVILLLTVAAAAQQPQAPIFRAKVEVLTVKTSVLDRDGKPIIDLTPADFTVTLDGKPRKVRDVRFFGDGGIDLVSRPEPAASAAVVNTSEDGRIVVFV